MLYRRRTASLSAPIRMKWSVLQLSTAVMFLVVDRPPDAVGYGNGAPRSSCDQLRPTHTPYKPQQTPNPFHVQLLDDVVDYRCGDTIRSKFLV